MVDVPNDPVPVDGDADAAAAVGDGVAARVAGSVSGAASGSRGGGRAHIFGFTPESLKAWCVERGMKAFRAGQILDWVYRRGVVDPARMTDLSAADRGLLAREMTFLTGTTLTEQLATDGTRKLLIQWDPPSPPPSPPTPAASSSRPTSTSHEAHTAHAGGSNVGGLNGSDVRSLPILGSGARRADGEVGIENDPTRQTECVMIPAVSKGEDGEGRFRQTACISSQVGCPVGCRFCASGLGGLDGNLSGGRIVEQVWRLQRLCADEARRPGDSEDSWGVGAGRITNIVFMGMGEPLSNFANVMHAVRAISADWGMGIGARRITISTVGLPKAIERLADELELPVTLALSLHAPNDEIRRSLIPWASYTTIEELLRACDRWFEKTGREITLEYTLLGGVNDRAEHARELAGVAKRLRANINLIRYNEVKGLPFARPRTEDVRVFQEILRDRGLNVHIRASRGRDIAAACGQLRHERVGAS